MRIPQFYDDKRAGTIFYPDIPAIAAQASGADLPPADSDRKHNLLLIVDMQVDFCDTAGSLYVPGAQEDLQRLIRFIYRQAEHISRITCSLDSHLPCQIFHPAWWADARGNHPSPFTIITYQDVVKEMWKPLVEAEWSVRYVHRLQAQSKKELTIWPYHCLIGGVGHTLDAELFSAVLWHSLARGSQPLWWHKGGIPETEHYSIVQPEIPVPKNPQSEKSREFLDLFKTSDRVFIAGEAESHCVLETLEDLVEEYEKQPEILSRIFVLKDCTSPIRHPEIDYEALTHQRFEEFAARGVHFIKSTDPIRW